MIYAEAAHFDGFHVAHCAAREDHLRTRRIAAKSIAAAHQRHFGQPASATRRGQA